MNDLDKKALDRYLTTEPERRVVLEPEERKVLLAVWALWRVKSHVPRQYDDGSSCDEHGCGICNGGLDAVEDYVTAMTTGIDQGPDEPPYTIGQPDDEELLLALGELAIEYSVDEVTP